MPIPPFLSAIAKMLGPYVGGSVIESANVGFSNNAQRLTAMLGRQASEMAPKASQLPKRQPVPVVVAPGSPTSRGSGVPPVITPPQAPPSATAGIRGATGRPGVPLPQVGEQRRPGAPPVRIPQGYHKKMLGVLGSLATAVPVWGKVTAAAVAAGVALVKMPSLIRGMAERQLSSQAHLSAYSGRIARTMAFMKLQDVHLGMRTAAQTERSFSFLGRQTRALKDTLQPYGAAWENVQNVTLGIGARAASEAIRLMEHGGPSRYLAGAAVEALGFGDPYDLRETFGLGGGDPKWHPFQVVMQEMKNPIPRNAGVGRGGE